MMQNIFQWALLKGLGDKKMINGFIRVAAATPSIKVADCKHNSEKIIELIKQAAVEKAAIAVFPNYVLLHIPAGPVQSENPDKGSL